MARFVLLACICFAVILPGPALAQMNPVDPHTAGTFACGESPTPGKRPPNTDCAILLHRNFAALPPGPLVWRFENFPTTEAAQANVMTHKHSGPETWFLLTGEQCLELPDRAVRARAGESMSAPAETPMKLNIVGPAKRDALFLIVHDSSKPFNTFLEFHPKGLCQK